MVANGGISHNPDFSNEVQAYWMKLGENVGVGGDVQSLMNAFVNSPYFRSDFIGLGPYRLMQWVQGSHVEFGRFNDYYQGRPADRHDHREVQPE